MGAALASTADRLDDPGLAGRVLTHMVSAVQRAEPCHEPYSHVYVENVFPDEVYDRILSGLPDPAYYTPLNLEQWSRPDGTSTRDRFFLAEKNIALLPDERAQLWRALTWVMSHPSLQKALFAKLAADLSLRFGIPPEQVTGIETFPRMLLLRDTEQYRIKPHPDGLETIVTMGFYLPADQSQVDLGTSVYVRRSVGEAVRSMSRFREVKRFPFRPNSAYAFAVNNRKDRISLHGVELVPGGVGIRNTILNRYVHSADAAEY
jgi:hypothetical protein